MDYLWYRFASKSFDRVVEAKLSARAKAVVLVPVFISHVAPSCQSLK